MAAMIRIAAIDNDPMVLLGQRALIDPVPDLELVITTTDVDRFIASGEDVAITSTDGTQWQPLRPISAHSIRALTVWRDGVIGVGDLGAHIRWPVG